jgi:hypothetical protein
MRRLISEEEASKMSLEEKYHIISAYMRGEVFKDLLGMTMRPTRWEIYH